MKGIFSLSAVLQVINLERQSCDIEARSDGKTGQLHFRDGDLVDAIADDLGGEDAAYAILGWDNPEFEVNVEDSPRNRNITTGLTGLLLETARRKDEEGLEGLAALEVAAQSEAALASAEAEPPDGSRTACESPAADWRAPRPALRQRPSRPRYASPRRPPKPPGRPSRFWLPPHRRPLRRRPRVRRRPPRPSAAPPACPMSAALKRVIDIAQDGLGDALLSADVYSSADGTSFIGVNSMPAACALFNQVTSRVDHALEKGSLPALGRYYLAELDGDKMMLVAPGGGCQLSLVVDSTRVQLGLLLNVILPEVLSALNGADGR